MDIGKETRPLKARQEDGRIEKKNRIIRAQELKLLIKQNWCATTKFRWALFAKVMKRAQFNI